MIPRKPHDLMTTVRQLEDAVLERLFYAKGTAADAATALNKLAGRRSYDGPKVRRCWSRLKRKGRLPAIRRDDSHFVLIAKLWSLMQHHQRSAA